MHLPFDNLPRSLSDLDIATPGGHFIQANISSATTLERRRMEQQVAAWWPRPGMLNRYIVTNVMCDIVPDIVSDIVPDIASDVVVYLR